MKVPGCTSAPTLCRKSLLYTKLSTLCVLWLRVRWGSKCTGSRPRTRRMPPRLGGPTAALQSVGGPEKGRAVNAALAARPACSSWRRLRPWACRGRVFCACIGAPPCDCVGSFEPPFPCRLDTAQFNGPLPWVTPSRRLSTKRSGGLVGPSLLYERYQVI